MPEKIGLEAVLADKQFRAGVKRYLDGVDAMDGANEDAKQSSAQLAKGMDTTADSMDDMGRSAIETEARLEIMRKAMSAVQMIAREGLELAKLGAQAERVERRFAAFAEEAGGATAVLESFQKGAGGTVSKMDAMSSASRLLQMGLVKDAAGMERVVEMATRLGDQTSSATDRVSDFALMLANQSIPRLDNFGISSGKVRARIAELQAQTEDMTREAAFMQAVFEQGGLSLTKLGTRVDDSAAAFERQEAKMADARVELGKKLAPAFAEFMGLLSDLIDIAIPLIDVISGLAEKVGDLATKLAEAAGIELGGIFDLAEAAQTAETLGELADGTELATKATSRWADMIAKMREEGKSTEQVVMALRDRIYQTGREFDKAGVFADIFVDQQGLMRKASADLHEVIKQEAGSFREYVTLIKGYNEVAPDANAHIEAMGVRMWHGHHILENVKTTVGELNINMEELGRQLGNVDAEMLATGQAAHVTAEEMQAFLDSMADDQAIKVMALGAQQMGDNIARATQLTGDAAAKQEEFAAKAKKAQEEAAAAAEESARRQAEAAATIAREQANLIEAMAGATQEMFNQQILSAVDPGEIGVDAWAALGQELGLLDQTQVNLAAAASDLIAAYNEGIIPTENMAEATNALFVEAQSLNPEFGLILDKFAESPGLIGPSKEALEEHHGALGDLTELMPDTQRETEELSTKFGDLGGSADTSSGQVEILSDKVFDVTQELKDATAKEWIIKVSYEITGEPPTTYGGEPGFQAGGVVPGPPGSPRRIKAHGGEIIINPFLTETMMARRRMSVPAMTAGSTSTTSNDNRSYTAHVDARGATGSSTEDRLLDSRITRAVMRAMKGEIR